MSVVRPVGVQPQTINPYNFKQNPRRTVQTSGFETQEKKPVNNKKVAFLVALGVGLATIGTIVVTRGRAARKAKLLNSIPAELRAKFEKIQNLEGKEFIHKSYDEMVDFMGLKGIAPKEIKIEGTNGVMTVTGGYRPIENTIRFSEGMLNIPKNKQLEMIAHELKHCKQFTSVYRTEGITIEKFAENWAHAVIQNALKDPLNMRFRMSYNQAKNAGREQEFITNVVKSFKEENVPQIKENFKDLLKMPKIKADSPEGKAAYKYLESLKTYEGLNCFGMGSDAYRNHLLEKEAYAFGQHINEQFGKYMKAIA